MYAFNVLCFFSFKKHFMNESCTNKTVAMQQQQNSDSFSRQTSCWCIKNASNLCFVVLPSRMCVFVYVRKRKKGGRRRQKNAHNFQFAFCLWHILMVMGRGRFNKIRQYIIKQRLRFLFPPSLHNVVVYGLRFFLCAESSLLF